MIHKTYILFFIFLILSFASNGALSPYQEKVIQTSGASIRLREWFSKNRPIILIHGGPGLPGYMISLADLLPNFHTVEYFQRDNTNSRSKGPFTVEAHVQDLKEIVRQYTKLSGKKPVLLGHSWGANLALEYSKRFSTEIERVVIISPGTMTPNMEEKFGKIFLRD